jgi:hypothetical protein
MKALIVSTVGTTAFTNPYVDSIPANNLRRWANQDARCFAADGILELALADEIVRVWGVVRGKGGQVPAEIASLAGLLGWCEVTPGDGSRFVFVASDTSQGKAAARVNLLAFRRIFKMCACAADAEGQCAHIKLESLPGVQPKDHQKFAKGVKRLRDVMLTHRAEFREGAPMEHRLVMNVTGGYKGLVPWAAEYARVLEFWVAYLYEESEHLIFKNPEADSVAIPEK